MLFTFPSRYWFTVGRYRVFSLTPWSARIHTKFHVHRATWDTERLLEPFDYGPITLFGRNFHSVRLGLGVLKSVPLPRRDKSLRFGLFRFRSPLLTESLRFLFLRILRCFTSPRMTRDSLCIDCRVPAFECWWVFPFGDLRVKAC